MRILVFGAGAVGSTFGGFLSKHHDVTLLGRKPHLDAIRKKGLRISGIWGKHCFQNLNLKGSSKALSRQEYDLVLLTVKAYDTEKAARELKRILGAKRTPVLALQNGLGNIEILHRYFPKKKILAGRVIFGAVLPRPGEIKITVISDPTAIGETSVSKMTPRVREIVRACVQAGLPVEACDNVQAKLWAKVIYNCALNPLASLLGCHYGYLMEKDSTRNVMNCVIEEIYALARKKRMKLQPASAKQYQKLFYSKLVPRTYHHHTSMLQDLRNRKPTEIESLNGAIARMGQKLRVPVPVNALLAELVREREKEV